MRAGLWWSRRRRLRLASVAGRASNSPVRSTAVGVAGAGAQAGRRTALTLRCSSAACATRVLVLPAMPASMIAWAPNVALQLTERCLAMSDRRAAAYARLMMIRRRTAKVANPGVGSTRRRRRTSCVDPPSARVGRTRRIASQVAVERVNGGAALGGTGAGRGAVRVRRRRQADRCPTAENGRWRPAATGTLAGALAAVSSAWFPVSRRAAPAPPARPSPA
jgi:hypothetical protein